MPESCLKVATELRLLYRLMAHILCFKSFGFDSLNEKYFSALFWSILAVTKVNIYFTPGDFCKHFDIKTLSSHVLKSSTSSASCDHNMTLTSLPQSSYQRRWLTIRLSELVWRDLEIPILIPSVMFWGERRHRIFAIRREIFGYKNRLLTASIISTCAECSVNCC